MSRKGIIPVDIPKEIKVKIESGTINLEGSKGKLDLKIPQGVTVEHKDEQLVVSRISDVKQFKANHGTTRALLANMVRGLTDGHKKDLEIQGIGFRAQLKGKAIEFNLGFSHPVTFDIPEDVNVTVPNQTSISVEGASNDRVGHVAAMIRDLKPVEPYKGKGIRYVGENVRRKQGKSVAK